MKTSICVFVSVLSCTYAIGLQVKTTEGIVEGYKANDGNYYKFYGIPYAGRVDGINRFKTPKPPIRYEGIFYAKDDSITCAQPSKNGIVGVENCLVLNIFTKNVTTSKPVIVWLDAEDYTTTANQIPSFRTFVEKDLVFVSLNFRLSVFGFLCLGIKEAPGNAGLKDIIQGLKWIKVNIANFGGDPNNVVLMGHASGAAMVDMITLSYQGKGLVHKAIALSGSGIAPWAVAFDPVGYASLVGAKLGYNSTSKEDLARYLMETDLNLFNTVLAESSHFKNNTLLFAPCVEDVYLNPADTVLQESPLHTLLWFGNYLQIPYIAGYNTREGTMREYEAVYDNWVNLTKSNFTDFLPVDLTLDNDKAKEELNDIYNFYFNKDKQDVDNFLKYEGDILVAIPVIRGARARSVGSEAAVRLLAFGYIGTSNFDWPYHDKIKLTGVRHGGILNYLFDYDLAPNEKSVMTSLVQRFVQFAYTGSQDPSTKPPIWPWEPVTKYQTNTLYYTSVSGVNLEECSEYINSEAAFRWASLYDKYHKYPMPVNGHHIWDTWENSADTNKNSFVLISINVVFAIISKLVIS